MNKEFKVKDIFQPQQVSEKLRKQEVLFTWNDGRWDHDVVIQFLNDRIDSLVQLNIGDTVEVGFDVESRRWEKDGVVRYFTSCTGWNVKIVGKNPAYLQDHGQFAQARQEFSQQSSVPQSQPQPQSSQQQQGGLDDFPEQGKDDDDLPF